MTKQFTRGTVICSSGQPFHTFYMIVKGTVRGLYSDGEFLLEKGDIIGLCELSHTAYLFTYTALDEVSVASFSYEYGELASFFMRQPDFASLAATSSFRQLKSIIEVYEFSKYDSDNLYQYLTDSYAEYSVLCQKHGMSPKFLPELENTQPLVLDEDIAEWLLAYYENIPTVIGQTLAITGEESYGFLNGLLMKVSQDIGEILSVSQILADYKADISTLLMNHNRLDLFDFYTTLFFRLGPSHQVSTSLSAAIGRMMINLEGFRSIDHHLYRSRVGEYKETLQSMEDGVFSLEEVAEEYTQNATHLSNSLAIILEYANCDAHTTSAMQSCIDKFKKIVDKNSADDEIRKLRLAMSKLFYTVYTNAFLKSLNDSNIPIILKMFFQFGYMDEEIAGIENACHLYAIANALPSDPRRQVYSIYEWLCAIYNGEKEPCRNEFDMDYSEYVHDMKVSGKITAQDEIAYMKDYKKKVIFELENMFPIVNKITFGRITTFCPIFSEHNVLKDLEKSLVTANKVCEIIDKIKSIDFGAFYRESVYVNPEQGIVKEYIDLEALPDIILMPNIGIRGVMWQEIEGKKRSTPARLMISVFEMEDLTTTLARLTGEFRWEMCKRIQGIRWNDLTDRSLTSEYFEYIQFYRKNHDLSSEAKDKIKSALQKAKNSYKEMFVRDYITWILYEGVGSPRLNKVARNILFTYCPFPAPLRERMKQNPLYKDHLDRYILRSGQKQRHMDMLCQKIRSSGLDIPAEILAQSEHIRK